MLGVTIVTFPFVPARRRCRTFSYLFATVIGPVCGRCPHVRLLSCMRAPIAVHACAYCRACVRLLPCVRLMAVWCGDGGAMVRPRQCRGMAMEPLSRLGTALSHAMACNPWAMVSGGGAWRWAWGLGAGQAMPFALRLHRGGRNRWMPTKTGYIWAQNRQKTVSLPYSTKK